MTVVPSATEMMTLPSDADSIDGAAAANVVLNIDRRKIILNIMTIKIEDSYTTQTHFRFTRGAVFLWVRIPPLAVVVI